jgi:pimeloyl-ACP methyl ester carboxylesterase
MLGNAVSIRSPEPYQDTSNPRAVRRVRIDDSSIDVDVMVYRNYVSDLKPLVIVNSIELPMPPSKAFCDLMWNAGYQVVFIRRPGFGGAPGLPAALLTQTEIRNGAAVITEAALLHRLIDTLGLDNFVLLGLGTANSVCVRLSKLCPKVEFAVFSNPLFHQDVWDIVRPKWMQSMVRQTFTSKGGLRFTVIALKAALKRNPNWFYRQFAQKSAGDVEYAAENKPDFEAAAGLLQNMEPETVYYDLQMALVIDTKVDADFFRDVNGVILCGTETTEDWRQRMQEQSERLAFPIAFAPSGDLFVPYKSPRVLLELLESSVRNARSA